MFKKESLSPCKPINLAEIGCKRGNMLIVSLIFFYTFPASLIFLHGIGLERLSMNARSIHAIIPFILKSGLIMFISALISQLLDLYVLFPLGLEVLLPFFSLGIVYLCELSFTRIVSRNTGEVLIWERLFTGGTVLFALYQAFNSLELIGIIAAALLSMVIWTCILYAIRRRIDESTVNVQWKNIPLLLICMGLIALALYAWDITWV